MTDSEQGRVALVYFHKESLDYNPSLPGAFSDYMGLLRRAYYPSNPNEAPASYKGTIFYPKSTDAQKNEFIYENLGLIIRSVGLSEADWKNVLAGMAAQGGGRIPATKDSFGNAIKSYKMDMNIYSFLDMADFVVRSSVKDVVEAVETGVSAVSTAIDVTKYAMVGGAVLFAGLIYKLFHRKKS